MDFKTHLETAWHQTLKYIAPLILMTLVMVVVSIVSVGILAMTMMAGYIKSILEMMRHDRQPQIQDLFSRFDLFLPLFGFSVGAAIAVAIGFNLLILPGLALVCLLAFGCLYMIPLMVDREMGLLEAIKTSWHISTQDNLADQVVVAILYVGFISIGVSTFGLGTLITQPFATVFLIGVYLEKQNKRNESNLTDDQPPEPDSCL